MLNIIGIIGSICLVISGVPQLYTCYKNGHADGVSVLMLFLWITGMTCLLFYILFNHPEDILLLANYSINIIVILGILRYKFFPNKKSVNIDI